MHMQVDSNMLQAQRKKRAWSQSELAQLTGLSLRTVQRIEKRGSASLESVKALASLYELPPASLQIQTAQEQKSVFQEPMFQGSMFQKQSQTPPQPHQNGWALSDQGIQLTLGLFIPAAMVMLFMLLTKLPNVDWVHATRSMLFSDNLPSAAILLLNGVIALTPILFLCGLLGVTWDLYKQQGAWFAIKQWLSTPFEMKKRLATWLVKVKRGLYLLKKPALFAAFLLVVSVTLIGLRMEPYQKANLKHFIAKMMVAQPDPS